MTSSGLMGASAAQFTLSTGLQQFKSKYAQSKIVIPGELLLLCIPVRLLTAMSTPSTKTAKLCRVTQENWEEKAELKAYLEETEGCSVYFVSQNKKGQLQIEGMDKRVFAKKYAVSLEDHVRTFTLHTSAGQSWRVVSNDDDRTRIIVRNQLHECYPIPASIIRDVLGLELSDSKTLQAVIKGPATYLKNFKLQLATIINKYGPHVCPNEYFRLLWDMLVQGVIDSCTDPVDKTALSKALLRHTEAVDLAIDSYITHAIAQNLTYVEVLRQLIVRRLDALDSLVEASSPSIQRALKEIQQPLRVLFDSITSLKDPRSVKCLAVLMQELYNFKLKDVPAYEVTTGSNPVHLKHWMVLRAAVLRNYLEEAGSEFVFKPIREGYDLCLFHLRSIISSLGASEWMEAYEQTDLVCRFLQNNHHQIRHSTKGPSNLSLIATRMFMFTSALKDDFEFLIKNGTLFSVISRQSVQEMHTAFQELQGPPPLLTQRDGSFKEWMQKMRQHPEGRSLATHFKLFHSCRKRLDSLWKLFAESVDFRSLLGAFGEGEGFSLETYQAIYHRYKPSMDAWKVSLNLLNNEIYRIQSGCWLMLLDPSCPEISVRCLQAEFVRINTYLEQLVPNPTKLMIAFEQLIHFSCDKREAFASSVAEGPSMDMESTVLYLFQTGEEYFGKLEEQIAGLRKSENPVVEMKIEDDPIPQREVAASCSSSSSTGTVPVGQVIDEALFSRRGRLVFKGVGELIKHYSLKGVGFSRDGSHRHLYINGLLVVIPYHKELKLGTFKSVKGRLQEIIVSQL